MTSLDPILLALSIALLIGLIVVNLAYAGSVLFSLVCAAIGAMVVFLGFAIIVTPQTLPVVALVGLGCAVFTLGLVNYGRHV